MKKLCSVMLVLIASAGISQAAITDLTSATQGEGNKGMAWVPIGSQGFEITARSSVDENDPFSYNASGSTGTIYVENKGAGVQDGTGGGSKGISGAGGDQNEELIFTFDNPVSLDSILLELNDIEFGKGLDDKDDPVIFISQAGSGLHNIIEEGNILSAFDFTDDKTGIIDFGDFSTLLGYSEIDTFTIRETHDHIYVNGISEPALSPTPVPAPGALVLASLGTSLAGFLRKRRLA